MQSIWDYLAAEAGEDVADRFLAKVNEKCRTFAGFPQAGRARNELIVNLRRFPVGNYLVFYMPLLDGIEILRVLHGAQDIPQVFEDMLPPSEDYAN